MSWEQTIVDSLKKADISLISYVPDHSIGKVASIIEKDDFFQLIPATREEEAIGIAVGGYAVGKKAAVFMQTSGFGNSVNALPHCASQHERLSLCLSTCAVDPENSTSHK